MLTFDEFFKIYCETRQIRQKDKMESKEKALQYYSTGEYRLSYDGYNTILELF